MYGPMSKLKNKPVTKSVGPLLGEGALWLNQEPNNFFQKPKWKVEPDRLKNDIIKKST
jgi:hypothetical protein